MINEDVYLESRALRLVPYLPHHVPRYHEWMCDPELLALTASEPLSLDEERDNQRSWLVSMDKLTFILLAPAGLADRVEPAGASPPPLQRLSKDVVGPIGSFDSPGSGADGRAALSRDWQDRDIKLLERLSAFSAVIDPISDTVQWPCDKDSELEETLRSESAVPLAERYRPCRRKSCFSGVPVEGTAGTTYSPPAYVMVGDCNLFLLGDSGDGDELDGRDPWLPQDPAAEASAEVRRRQRPHRRTFEVEVMIADALFRRKGLAEVAVRQLMQYAVAVLGATDFVAKIIDHNRSSLALFQEKLRFSEFKRVPAFQEVHLRRSLQSEMERARWEEECGGRHAGSLVCAPYGPDVEAQMIVFPRLS